MEFSKIIIKPLLTEKSDAMKQVDPKQYMFEVNPKANKHQIIEAFMAIYQIAPTKVNTTTRKPAKVRTGTIHPGYTKLTKIAYITLPVGKDIAVDSETAEKMQDAAQVAPKAEEKKPAKGTLKETSKVSEDKKEVEKPNK